MAAEGSEIGVPANDGLSARIRDARKARGLSREAVAALCGKSEEWLRQIERGRRGTSLRMLARLADVLRVKDLSTLLGDHAPTAAFARPEHPALSEFRRALATLFPNNPDSTPTPSVSNLQARVRYAWQRRSVSHRDRTDLAVVLPGLVDAQRATTTRNSVERRSAYQLLAEVYHLAQLYLCYQNAPELLWVAVDRGMSAALASENPAAVGRAAWFMAYLYRDFGSLDQAHQVVEDALRHLDAAPDESGELLWQRSIVHLASAWNHAREYRPALAWRAWDAAVDARSRCGMPGSPDVLFGTTIEDVALALEVELGRSAAASRRAEAIDLRSVPSTPRRARLAIEASRALMLRREYAGALHTLRRAYEISSEATLYSMYARSTVSELHDRVGPLLRAEAAGLAEELGVPA